MPDPNDRIRLLKIGGIRYTIRQVKDLRDGDEKLDGHIHYSLSKIDLDADLLPQAWYATLWHEILHAILTHAGQSEHDEARISALAYGIMQVLRDNPWLRSEFGYGDYIDAPAG